MTYEEIKEEFAYSVISLLCDIGGTLGLLLGASGIVFFYVTIVFKILTVVNAIVNHFQSSMLYSMRITFFSFNDGTIYGELCQAVDDLLA